MLVLSLLSCRIFALKLRLACVVKGLNSRFSREILYSGADLHVAIIRNKELNEKVERGISEREEEVEY